MNLTGNLSFEQVIMDGIQDMIFVINVQNEPQQFFYQFMNKAAMNKTGLTEEVFGKTIQEIYPNKLGDFLHNQYAKALTQSKVVTYEDSYVAPSGKKKYSETTLTPMFNHENKCTSIVAVVKDITEKKNAELDAEVATRKLHESMKKYQSLYNYNLDAVTTIDLDGKIIRGNAYTERITGYPLSRIIGEHFLTLVIKEKKVEMRQKFEEAIKGQSQQLQTAITNKSGHRVDLIFKFTPIIINEKITGVFGVFKDISEQEKTIKMLKESEERFRIITENAHELITLLNDQGKIIYASPSYKDILGADPNDYIGKLFLYNVHPDDQMKLDKSIITSIKTGKPCTIQFRQQHQDKGWIWCDLTGRPVFDEKGQFVNMVVLTRDITIQKEYENSLKYFANHDTLTGLPNRRYFNVRLKEALADLYENNHGLAVMMVDIDDFKNINDNFGHDVGDAAVTEFAGRLHHAVRDTDMVARLGGDEFVVLLCGVTNKEEAYKVATKVQEAMKEKWNIKGVELSITTSIGIAISPQEGTTRTMILKHADIALYQAKESGKNCIKVIEI